MSNPGTDLPNLRSQAFDPETALPQLQSAALVPYSAWSNMSVRGLTLLSRTISLKKPYPNL